MQDLNALPRTFLHRTDFLAARLGINVQDLPERLGISRRTLFAARSDESTATQKTWHKLAQAEREAGIADPFQQQIQSATVEQKEELIESASVLELVSLLGDKGRRSFLEFQLQGLEDLADQYSMDVEGLRLTAEKLRGVDLETERDRAYFCEAVKKMQPQFDEWVRLLISQVKEALALEEDESAEIESTKR